MPPEASQMMAEFNEIMKIDRYLDIPDPLLTSP
jgi:hypothetical protein